MQHQKDLNSEIAELFLSIKEHIKSCIGGKVKEKYSQNITSLYSKYGGICYLKTQNGMVRIGWFRGASIDDKYSLLGGNGSVLRTHFVKELDERQKEAMRYYVDETIGWLIEHNELKKLKPKRSSK